MNFTQLKCHLYERWWSIRFYSDMLFKQLANVAYTFALLCGCKPSKPLATVSSETERYFTVTLYGMNSIASEKSFSKAEEFCLEQRVTDPKSA
jgi:hypothetical protein